MLTAAANVAMPRAARTTLTWLPFGLTPLQPSPIRPSRSGIGREIEDHAQRLARTQQLEAAVDLVERKPVRDQPVERQHPAAVEVEDLHEVALRPRRTVQGPEHPSFHP